MLRGSPRIVLAPDKFKGTLSAGEVADCLSAGIRGVLPAAATRVLPVADGGDGTLEVALAAEHTLVEVPAAGPRGEPTRVGIATRGSAAVVELASICGLQELADGQLLPERCTTLGLGLALRAALELGFRRLVVGLGGSASTDGGAGMLVGLGARLLDDGGREVPPTPQHLAHTARLDLSTLTPAATQTDFTFAVDVDTPLLGPHGAAHVFGPQKGADPEAVQRLEQAMARWSRLVQDAIPEADPQAAGAGAAGGTGFAGLALGGQLRSGSDLCLDLSGFDEALCQADVVVTGEGRLDAQTLLGKAPLKVAARAKAAGLPAIAVVGSRSTELSDRVLADHGFGRVYALVDEAPGAGQDPALSRRTLRTIGARIARDLCQFIPSPSGSE
ncbi:MAG TPA: glycerate kinase [Nocardioidaceae bacterium]|nr:glycerate kinase [Nocardioidaceae bacterium]